MIVYKDAFTGDELFDEDDESINRRHVKLVDDLYFEVEDYQDNEDECIVKKYNLKPVSMNKAEFKYWLVVYKQKWVIIFI